MPGEYIDLNKACVGVRRLKSPETFRITTPKKKYCKNLKGWPYGSFQDYYGLRNGTLYNKKLAIKLLVFSENDFKYPGIASLVDDIISTLF